MIKDRIFAGVQEWADTNIKISKLWAILSWSILIGFCIYTGNKYAENILVIQAYGGWSPMDWVNHQLFSENFEKDYPSGIAAYRMSSFMNLYLIVAKLGVDLEWLVPFVVYFEIIFRGLCAAVLFKSIITNARYAPMIVFSILVVQGGVQSINLGNFGGAFYQGLYYNFSEGLIFLGIAAVFRGRMLFGAILLALSITIHPIKGGMAILLVAPYLLITCKKHSWRTWAVSIGIFISIVAAWFVPKLLTSEIVAGGISRVEWVSLGRMFSVHLYPVDVGLFNRMHAQFFLPLLCLISLAITYLPIVITNDSKRCGILWAMAILSAITCVGVFSSELSTNPFLIKLGLQRSSEVLIIVCLIVFVAGVFTEIDRRNLVSGSFGAAMLVTPLFPTIFPAIPTMILIGTVLIREHGRMRNIYFALSVGSLLALGAVTSLYTVSQWANMQAYVGNLRFWYGVAVSFVVLIIYMWFKKMQIDAKNDISILERIFQPSVVFICAFLFMCIELVANVNLIDSDKKKFSSDYLEAQRWARVNSDYKSVFMVDPTIYYGWRDFSQRSSFGNVREWLHTSWLYDSSSKNYGEGIRRFGEFGLDIENFKTKKHSIDGSFGLTDAVRSKFYNGDEDWFLRLSNTYSIKYLVMRNKYMVKKLGFPKVFENSGITIYQLR